MRPDEIPSALERVAELDASAARWNAVADEHKARADRLSADGRVFRRIAYEAGQEPGQESDVLDAGATAAYASYRAACLEANAAGQSALFWRGCIERAEGGAR